MAQGGSQAWWTTYGPLITFAGALIGATLAQFVAHCLTRKRERAKADMLAYEKLYSPVLVDLCGYYEGVNAVKTYMMPPYDDPGHLVDLPDKILAHISSNLQYAPPELLQASWTTVRHQLHYDYMGEGHEVERLIVFDAFLEGLYKTLLRLFPKDNLTYWSKLRLKFRLWIAVLSVPNISTAAPWDLMRMSFMLDKFLTVKFIDDFLDKTSDLVLPSRPIKDSDLREALDELFGLSPEFLPAAEKESNQRGQVPAPQDDSNLL